MRYLLTWLDIIFFQSFIGQKYGAARLPSLIEVEELNAIKSALEADKRDISELTDWYEEDLNVTPNVYRLQQQKMPSGKNTVPSPKLFQLYRKWPKCKKNPE